MKNRFWQFGIWRILGTPWGLFLLAMAVRLIAAAALNYYLAEISQRDYLVEGDADGYWQLAQQIVAGNDYAIYSPPRYVLRMPGFPAVLAGSITLFGESHEAARYLLAGLTSLAVFPGFWLAQRLRSRQAGQLCGLIIALTPVYVGFSATLLTECLFAAVLLWAIWAYARCLLELNGKSWGKLSSWAALSGILTGVAVYLKPGWLLFPWGILLLIPFLPNFRSVRFGWASLVMTGCLLLSLLPWGLRNQQVTGHFLLTSLWMGPSLYDGLRPGATGASDMTFFDDELLLNKMSEYEMNEAYKQRAWAFVRENPGETIRLAGVKLWRFWKPWPSAQQFRNPILQLAVGLFFINLICWAIYGSWELRKQLWLVLLCWLPIVYFTAVHLLFVSSLRYRIPAEFPLAILAAVGLASWLSKPK